MQLDSFTQKSREAIQASISLAAERKHAQVAPIHLLAALLRADDALVRRILDRIGATVDAEVDAALDALPDARPRSPSRRPIPTSSPSCAPPSTRRARCGDEYITTEHLLLVARRPQLARRRGRCARAGATKEAIAEAVAAIRGSHRATSENAEDAVRVAREVRQRPDAGRRGRQARPGDRARRRDPPRDPGPLPPHEEQPGADRRAGRRQDGDRRGPRPADRLRRRPRVAARPQA